MSEIVNHFVEAIRESEDKLAGRIENMGEKGQEPLLALLKRFDHGAKNQLDEEETRLALRIVKLLHRPSASGFTALLSVFDYLDTNKDEVMSFQELLLTIELLEHFANADSVNGTLSTKEIDMLTAVLQYEDKDGNGVLDEKERSALHDALWDADAYLEEQKKVNPHLRKVLGLD